MDAARRVGFEVEARAEGAGLVIGVRAEGRIERYHLPGVEQHDYADFYGQLANGFGTRSLRDAPAAADRPRDPRWQPLLTQNLGGGMLYGYGDPAVLRTEGGYVLTVTSNNAPDAFPILRSDDLKSWRAAGFVFPDGMAPRWTVTGRNRSDFWAPEMARVGEDYWLAYTARANDQSLSIGIARSRTPEGPWRETGKPLIRGSVIDAHIFVDADGAPHLFWKRDTNGKWPRPLAQLMGEKPELIDRLFDNDVDRRTAAFAAAIEPFAATRPPMERFFLMQPLIRAVSASWPAVPQRLRQLGVGAEIVEWMHTPILAQQLSPERQSLLGEPRVVLTNDLEWEGHLVEGPWVTLQNGRYWLFYAGNDFTSPSYGIGVAVADELYGPYCKHPKPLLQSNADWIGPGHASVAAGPDGQPQIFFHAYLPGTGGYNAFRALLTARLRFDRDRVELV